jgi:ribosomal protein L21
VYKNDRKKKVSSIKLEKRKALKKNKSIERPFTTAQMLKIIF